MPDKIVVRTYKGTQEQAIAAFQDDAHKMAAQGYIPVSQTWAPGSWGCGGFILALLLCLIVIGFIALIYMLIVKPDGSLTVTYEYRGVGQVAPAQPEKTCPKCAETVKAAAVVCRFCGYDFPAVAPASPRSTSGGAARSGGIEQIPAPAGRSPAEERELADSAFRGKVWIAVGGLIAVIIAWMAFRG